LQLHVRSVHPKEDVLHPHTTAQRASGENTASVDDAIIAVEMMVVKIEEGWSKVKVTAGRVYVRSRLLATAEQVLLEASLFDGKASRPSVESCA